MIAPTRNRARKTSAARPAGGAYDAQPTLFGKPVWVLYLAFAAVAITAYATLLSSKLMNVVYPSYTLVAVAVFSWGIRRNRPARPLAFWLFGLGILSTALGDVIYTSYESVFSAEIPYPSIADVPYILAYVFWAAGLLVLVRGRRGGGDVGGWIDTAIAITAFALLEFVLLIYPYLSSPDMPLLGRLVSAAYPVGDLLMVGVLVRLLVSPGSRTMAFRFLAAGFLACFVSDAVYGVVALNNTYTGGLIDIGWMAGYTLFAAVSLHPSVRTLARRVPDRRPRLSRQRLIALAALALVAPGLFAFTAGTKLSLPLGAAIAVGAAGIFLLVVLRMAGLVRTVDRTMKELVVAHEWRDRLLHQTLRTSEDDRLRLAAELHDGPVQQLTALSYRVGSLSTRAANGKHVSAEDLQLVQEMLAARITELRRMMTTLRPGSLEERGLEGAIVDYLSELSPNGDPAKTVEVRLSGRLRTDVETILYRVAQGAVENAVRHAHAASLLVSVREDDEFVYLEVRDDGVGFDVEESAAVQAGVMTMREWIDMAGGTFALAASPGNGTSVRATVPKDFAR